MKDMGSIRRQYQNKVRAIKRWLSIESKTVQHQDQVRDLQCKDQSQSSGAWKGNLHDERKFYNLEFPSEIQESKSMH